MNSIIWIVYPYGNIIDEDCREMRYVMFGKELANNGYKVIWWTANFNHSNKQFRCDGYKTINVCENFDIVLVPTTAYSKNISLGRVKFERRFVRNLKKSFYTEKEPNLILTSGTGLFSAFRPIWPYMKKKNVPVVFDIMDVHMINEYMKKNHKLLYPFVKLLTKINEAKEKSFYKNVSAVSALGRNQLEIAKKRTGNRNIPSCLVYNSIYVEEFRKHLHDSIPYSLPEKGDNDVWCVYAGSLGPSYNIESVIRCAERFSNQNVKFIIAGNGPQKDLLIEKQKELSNLIYLGTVKPEYLASIYNKCDIGLCPFASFSTVDMPDKFYDYCAAGLAIINSLKGEISSYISNKNLGINYNSDDKEGLANSLEQLLTNKAKLETFKHNSFELAPYFDIKSLLSKMIDMISTIIKD